MSTRLVPPRLGAEQLGVAARVHDVVVAGERPVAGGGLAVLQRARSVDRRRRVERDRVLVAQEAEDGFALGVGLRPRTPMSLRLMSSIVRLVIACGPPGASVVRDGSVPGHALLRGPARRPRRSRRRVRHRRRDRRDGGRGRGRRARRRLRHRPPGARRPLARGRRAPRAGAAGRPGVRGRGDPTVMLHTHVYVAAYRNPFLAAKGVATLRTLSGGRVILGVAAGYLRPEFARARGRLRRPQRPARRVHRGDAAGVDRGRRRGRGRALQGPRGHDAPAAGEPPHPPIWIGGNSNPAMRRAVELGDGWSPFPNPPAAARAMKTPAITSIDELAARSTRRVITPRRSGAPSRSRSASRRSARPTTRPSSQAPVRRGSRCSSTATRPAPSGSIGCGRTPPTRSGGS